MVLPTRRSSDLVGLGPVKSRVARFTSRPARLSAALVFRTAERRGLTVSLPLQLFQSLVLFFDLSLSLFQLPLQLYVLQGQMQDVLHRPLAELSQELQLLQTLRGAHVLGAAHKCSRNRELSGRR